MRIKIALFLLSFFPALALAEDYHASCLPTPSSTDKQHYPGREAIVSSNNLIMPSGKAVAPEGQKVYISGHVLDSHCVPVSDAVVEIWQTNVQGQHVVASMSDRLSPYPYFTGSGRAVTDNLGRFSFITLFPGAESDISAPHINFHVTQNTFAPVYTQMFFADDRRNLTDIFFSSLAFERQDLLLGKVTVLDEPKNAIAVNWDIVLQGTNTYRKF